MAPSKFMLPGHKKSRPVGAALSSNQNLIHVSDGFAVNLKNHVHPPVRGRMKKVTRGGDFFVEVA